MGKMPMSNESDAYQSYLLRLWRARCQGEWQWRASIESRRTGEHQVFGSLEQLFAFLHGRCEDEAETWRGGDTETRAAEEGKRP
jgi:hypothetical protein